MHIYLTSMFTSYLS